MPLYVMYIKTVRMKESVCVTRKVCMRRGVVEERRKIYIQICDVYIHYICICIYTYIYISTYIRMCVYIYVYTYENIEIYL